VRHWSVWHPRDLELVALIRCSPISRPRIGRHGARLRRVAGSGGSRRRPTGGRSPNTSGGHSGGGHRSREWTLLAGRVEIWEGGDPTGFQLRVPHQVIIVDRLYSARMDIGRFDGADAPRCGNASCPGAGSRPCDGATERGWWSSMGGTAHCVRICPFATVEPRQRRLEQNSVAGPPTPMRPSGPIERGPIE